MADKTRDTIIVVTAVVLLIAAAVSTTVYLQRTGALDGDAGDSGGYKNVTMTDALFACEEKLKRKAGKQLMGHAMDNLSSRFDESKKAFLVFLTANLKKGTSITNNYVFCKVKASNGRVAEFTLSEQKFTEEGGRKLVPSGNPFGF
ncbi:hypothetical protein [Marinibactrum halimedae]|uniref:Uncharacterized protein n=1 Tax=Marinibactrum halimedae TaxID=1444977 RepID=A0AA37WLN8_9GAMM|nr:hypothetical protein [Marinibactrum halimedae]MCD9459305.1 hypothetical protein [Marinibactrum halimedae]GLS25803.1 hypothetical protein GCM10007877_15170 [Marinibactrum halimedae]